MSDYKKKEATAEKKKTGLPKGSKNKKKRQGIKQRIQKALQGRKTSNGGIKIWPNHTQEIFRVDLGKCELQDRLEDSFKHEQAYDTSNNVATQPHYTQFKIQPIEFIEVNNLGWCAGNVIKYVCRQNLKNGLEDLLKARTYLDCLIHQKKTGEFITPDKLAVMAAKASTSPAVAQS